MGKPKEIIREKAIEISLEIWKIKNGKTIEGNSK